MLTFDVEDFINPGAILALRRILKLLRTYDFRAIFFVTGNMAEKLHLFPEILALLEVHEIGYHSSSHSVAPRICEYTDVENYEEARLVALERETSHINPLTGEKEGKGGIVFLRELLPSKGIVAFRAPGFCWSPPHLEAVRELGIRFDFSAKIAARPVDCKGITFYPFPVTVDGVALYRGFLSSVSRNEATVLVSHPNSFVNSTYWGCVYWNGNPRRLSEVPQRSWKEIESRFLGFELFLKWLKLLQQAGMIEVAPHLARSGTHLTITKADIIGIHERSMKWARHFYNYEPKHQLTHFFSFFDVD